MSTAFPALALDAQRIGTVIELDLALAMARVEAGDIESGWLSWASGRAGDTRTWSPPSVGEQVYFTCPDGDLEGGFICGSLFCDAHAAPGNTTRELVTFKDGCVLAYDPESHHLEAILPAGGQVTLTADSGVTLNVSGGMTINGDVTLNGGMTATDDVVAGGISLINHKHPGVQAGGAQTGKPV